MKLILNAPADVTVELYKGKELVEEAEQSALSEGKVTHIFTAEPDEENIFWFHAFGDTYYDLSKNIYLGSAETVTVDADPGHAHGQGYETLVLHQHSDEVVRKMLPVKAEWREKFPEVYTTPKISSTTKYPHEFTTQEEMAAFLDALPKRFTRLSAGHTESEFHEDLPLLIFTKSDIEGLTDLTKIAEVLKKDGRLTLLYTAQIHGQEVAAGDAALAVAKALSEGKGEEILDAMNILIVPRVNPDGARLGSRRNAANGIDMNRDFFRLLSAEVAAVEHLFRVFWPEVVIDGHEYTLGMHQKINSRKDVFVGIGGGVNTDKTLVGCSTKVTNEVIRTLNQEGFIATYYPAPEFCGAVRARTMVDTANWGTGRSYFSLMGAVSILVESMGYTFGGQNFERRLVSNYLTVWSLLENFGKNTEEIRRAVLSEREGLSLGGGKFSEDRTFCLYSGSTFEKYETCRSPKFDYRTGEYAEDPATTIQCPYYDKAERERPRATGFAVSKDAAQIGAVMEIIGKHHIAYREIAPGESLPLRQYHGEVIPLENSNFVKVPEATLDAEREITFPNGGYFFPCNQPAALLMMYLFEPDVTDTENYGSSFTQSGRLLPEEIFRYERDL